MAAEQSPEGAGNPADYAILFNGFVSILGACWGEAASSRQPRRNYSFVDAHDFQHKGLSARRAGAIACNYKPRQNHLSAPRRATNSVRKSSSFRSFVERLGFSTKSNPEGIDVRDVRRISLTRLFTRFLSWALPSFRGVVSPKRL